MIIENPRAGMLSNFEVLRLLEEQQAKQTEARDAPDGISVPENLRTVQFEASQRKAQTWTKAMVKKS